VWSGPASAHGLSLQLIRGQEASSSPACRRLIQLAMAWLTRDAQVAAGDAIVLGRAVRPSSTATRCVGVPGGVGLAREWSAMEVSPSRHVPAEAWQHADLAVLQRCAVNGLAHHHLVARWSEASERMRSEGGVSA